MASAVDAPADAPAVVRVHDVHALVLTLPLIRDVVPIVDPIAAATNTPPELGTSERDLVRLRLHLECHTLTDTLTAHSRQHYSAPER